MALVELEKTGIMKFLVSTNVDGLHRRAGTSESHVLTHFILWFNSLHSKLAELHGNCYLEKCTLCSKQYLRKFDVSKLPRPNHRTGRVCDDSECGGELMDTIINFGENLPDVEILNTMNHSSKSDLALVLGTSMRVSPACTYPSKALDNGGKMVIVRIFILVWNNFLCWIVGW